MRDELQELREKYASAQDNMKNAFSERDKCLLEI